MLKGGVGRVICGFVLFMPVYSHGAPITGSALNIGGNFNVRATFLNWNCNQPGDLVCVPTLTVSNSTGTFAQYNATFALIPDINDASQPLNTSVSLPDLNNNETITLTFLPVGAKTPSSTCSGLTDCTPQGGGLVTPTNPMGLSAFSSDQNATGAASAITGNTTQTAGTLSGINPTGALTGFAAAGGPSGMALDQSGEGVLDPVVPEPVTLALTGAGLLSLGFLRRWRFEV